MSAAHAAHHTSNAAAEQTLEPLPGFGQGIEFRSRASRDGANGATDVDMVDGQGHAGSKHKADTAGNHRLAAAAAAMNDDEEGVTNTEKVSNTPSQEHLHGGMVMYKAASRGPDTEATTDWLQQQLLWGMMRRRVSRTLKR